MTDISKKSTLKRRLFVSLALIALLGIFLSMYYFIYIPQQQVSYNKSTLRILKEITTNFSDRLLGHDNASAGKLNKKNSAKTYELLSSADSKYDSTGITTKLSKIEGRPQKDVTITESPTLKTSYEETPAGDSAKKIIAKIFEPIISIHKSTFESVIVVHLDSAKKEPHMGQLIYKTSGLTIDEEINIDSLLKKPSAFTFPVLQDINIGGADYKIFLFPFRIQHEKFLAGGFVSKNTYKVQTHNFPVISLVILGILLISVLFSLPFLKIYLIGPQENISVKDVRSVIAVIYIIPFFIVLLGSAAWLYYTNNIKSATNLSLFHKQVKTNFYNEIKQCIKQLKDYDFIYNNNKAGFDSMAARIDTNVLKGGKVSFVDAYMHPAIYKNMNGVFWINDSGYEIAKWNFIDSLPRFFDKTDRQYYQDIKNGHGYSLPGDTTTFAIEPTLANSTGEYTINVAIKSKSSFTNGRAILIGLHGKMYSVFNPVVPKGYNFCIINSGGNILYHSEYERGLQENLFDELNNNEALRIAVSHKDNLLLDNVKLYGSNVKLLMKPLERLPYFLAVYSNNKLDLLFMLHILAFSFLCESFLLIVVSLVTLFYYHSSNKFSKLFFTENDLNFTRPSPYKKEYYKKILYYQLAIFLLMTIAFIFFNGKDWLSYILYTSILLPLFSVIGYYLIRTVENYTDATALQKNTDQSETVTSSQIQTKSKLRAISLLFKNKQFSISLIKIIVPYLILIWLFFLIKGSLESAPVSQGKIIVNFVVVLFVGGFPLIAVYLSLFGLPRWLIRKKPNKTNKNEHAYLSYFIVAIMASATLTSIMPTIGFMMYAAGQERSLQLKARQVSLAEKLDDRRNYVNNKAAAIKLKEENTNRYVAPSDTLFLDSLRFSKAMGLYLSGNSLSREQSWAYDSAKAFYNSYFYKQITQYLFLPAEHSDYFDNTGNFYYWTTTHLQPAKKDSLVFHYKNATDKSDSSNVVLTSFLPPSPSLLSLLHYWLGAIIILIALLLLIAFYKIIYSTSVRIFLIDYFDKPPGADQDKFYLDKEFFEKENIYKKEFDRDFWQQDKLSLDLIISKEKAYNATPQKEENILKIQTLLKGVYDKIWNSLTPIEQYVLYDFAIDGFTNYKNVDVLYVLYKEGLIKKVRHFFVVMTDSFRNYLVSKTETDEVQKLKREISEGGTWGNLRTVLLIIIFLIVVFLFIVQEDVSKRVFAIVTSIGASIPFILKLFDRNLSGAGGREDSSKK